MMLFNRASHYQRTAASATEDSVVSKMTHFCFSPKHNFRNFNDFQTEHVVSHCITVFPTAGLLLSTRSVFVSRFF